MDTKKIINRIAGTIGTRAAGDEGFVQEVIISLEKAFCDEWQAYYQYWLGSKLIKGRFRKDISDEFSQHAYQEYGHAEKIADRLIELGGVPALNPNLWEVKGSCLFIQPDQSSNFDSIVTLKQNISGEQCAIKFYRNLLDFVRNRDDVTYNMIASILADEVRHEEDLQMFLDDVGDDRRQP